MSSPQPIPIPQNILAFRTITMMLALIQQKQPFKLARETKPKTRAETIELRLSNAFATLAVAQHDVVAVSTNFSPEHVEVIVSTSYIDKNKFNIKPQPPSNLTTFWRTMFSRNPRSSEHSKAEIAQAENTLPFTIKPTIPEELQPMAVNGVVDENALNKYLDKLSLEGHKSKLANHLWILGQLLSRKEPKDLSKRLIRYVVATCHEKILRRMQNKTFSLHYISSLKGINLDNVAFDPQYNPSTATQEEINADKKLLQRFIIPLDSELSATFPNIIEQAKLCRSNKPFTLYSIKTCKEFHLLLLFLLQSFQDDLESMKNPTPTGTATDTTDTFVGILTRVVITSFAIQQVIDGTALKQHLKSIEGSLLDHRRVYAQDEEFDEEFDVELRAVQPFVSEPGVPIPGLWESYRDWIKLMVVHFNAATILIHYLTPHQSLIPSIKILVSPAAGADNMEWRTLLQSREFFPEFSFAISDKTNKQIIEFLNTAIRSNTAKTIKWATMAKLAWANGNINDTIIHLKNIQANTTVPSCSNSAQGMLLCLEGHTAYEPNPSISNEIQSIFDTATLFFSFEKKMSTFSGTLHCEACLASFLVRDSTIDDKNKDLVNEMKIYGRVIGISKRCCPVCHQLLLLLTTDDAEPFIVRGSHTTVTACTLPSWLPPSVLDAMIKIFGNMLRVELLDLMETITSKQSRRQSTGSGRLSVASSVGRHDDVGQPMDPEDVSKAGFKYKPSV